jgi:hypothetical protein
VAPVISPTFPDNPVFIAAPYTLISSHSVICAPAVMQGIALPSQTEHSTTGMEEKDGYAI